MADTDASPNSTNEVTLIDGIDSFRFELLPLMLQEIWAQTPEKYLHMTEEELREEVQIQCEHHPKKFALLVKVKMKFWEEYEASVPVSQKMRMHHVIYGICHPSSYIVLFQKSHALLPWVLCPISQYEVQRKVLGFLAEERMLEILSLSAVKPDGRVDSRLAKIQFEYYQDLQDRMYGPVIQRIQSEQKSVNVNVNSNESHAANSGLQLITDVDELNRRLKVVREKRKAIQNMAQPIAVNTKKLMKPDQREKTKNRA